ncbi:hypothetical protein SK128_014496 [Halocaridina rubra]|uniref:Secreted protein n=1 Tax=Halocaridina rubra TaxID=373956 RepID=A0AAN8X7V1_HALRR
MTGRTRSVTEFVLIKTIFQFISVLPATSLAKSIRENDVQFPRKENNKTVQYHTLAIPPHKADLQPGITAVGFKTPSGV